MQKKPEEAFDAEKTLKANLHPPETPKGFKDHLNIYTCRACCSHIVTKDVDYGVSPFVIDCRAKQGCKGSMQSSFYRVFDQAMAHSHEWYRPTQIEDSWNEAMREHWRKGGLFLREVK